MEPLILASFSIYRYRLPFTTPVAFGGEEATHREGFLVRLVSAAGAAAWGEASPLPGFSAERPGEALEQLRRLCTAMRGRPITPAWVDTEGPWYREIRAMELPPSVCFAFETAAWQLYGAAVGRTLPQLCTAEPRDTVALNALLIGSGPEVEARARSFAEQGYGTVKLKVGRAPVEADIEQVRRVRRALGPEVSLRLDANRAWSATQALAFGEGVRGCGVEYLEEPLADPEGLPALAAALPVPVALDETVVGLEPESLVEHTYARALVLKPMLLGWGRSLRLARVADTLGLTPVVSSCFETGVGMRALVALAAAAGTRPAAAGLDTYRWLADDVIAPRLDVARPCVEVRPLMQAAWRVQAEALDPVD
jgi:O-succinylbenzoate synthase